MANEIVAPTGTDLYQRPGDKVISIEQLASEGFHFVLIAGQRNTGKSTLLAALVHAVRQVDSGLEFSHYMDNHAGRRFLEDTYDALYDTSNDSREKSLPRTQERFEVLIRITPKKEGAKEIKLAFLECSGEEWSDTYDSQNSQLKKLPDRAGSALIHSKKPVSFLAVCSCAGSNAADKFISDDRMFESTLSLHEYAKRDNGAWRADPTLLVLVKEDLLPGGRLDNIDTFIRRVLPYSSGSFRKRQQVNVRKFSAGKFGKTPDANGYLPLEVPKTSDARAILHWIYKNATNGERLFSDIDIPPPEAKPIEKPPEPSPAEKAMAALHKALSVFASKG
jgi:energy-coupling factor transporter ATP-binding protein EcfA2